MTHRINIRHLQCPAIAQVYALDGTLLLVSRHRTSAVSEART